MKKFVFIILGLISALYLTGCGKKQEALEEMQEPMSMEALSRLPAEAPQAAEPKAQPAPEVALATTTEFSKPTNKEIQTALKNAGYYMGDIDGKIGPMTKKAIEEFQKVNNLKVDGKAGPKTWAVLSPYLNPPAEPKSKKKR